MQLNQNNQHQSLPKMPRIKVVGLGGGGSNAINRMIEQGLRGVEFIAVNTDAQALESSLAEKRIQIGPRLTRGLGAGGDPWVGFNAAEESRKELREALDGADMVFLTAGMGGGTGTGSIAVTGEIARSIGAVTIAVVTTPFTFEMGTRQKNALQGLQWLQPHTDTLITIPNDRLLFVAPNDLPMEAAFHLADDVLRQAVQGIAELTTEHGLINVDFAHIRNMMKRGGSALMAIGQGRGENRVMDAVKQALNHPLLESICLEDASGVIANFSGDDELGLLEIGAALTEVQKMAGDSVDLVWGATTNNHMDGKVQVILIITGIGAEQSKEAVAQPENDLVRELFKKPAMEEAILSQHAAQAPMTRPFHPQQPKTARQPVNTRGQEDLDIPAFMRKRQRYNPAQASGTATNIG